MNYVNQRGGRVVLRPNRRSPHRMEKRGRCFRGNTCPRAESHCPDQRPLRPGREGTRLRHTRETQLVRFRAGGRGRNSTSAPGHLPSDRRKRQWPLPTGPRARLAHLQHPVAPRRRIKGTRKENSAAPLRDAPTKKPRPESPGFYFRYLGDCDYWPTVQVKV